MKLANRVLSGAAAWLLSLSERIEYRSCAPDIFLYRDCFDTIRVLIRFIKPRYLCDIGAHAGNWTYVMSQMNCELKHAVFFEPQTLYVQKLQSLSLPGVQKVVYEYGLGEKEELITVKGGTASASFLEAAPTQSVYFPDSIHAESEEVPVKILDEVYAKDDLPYPDVVKLDVQGFELNVLHGAVNVLSQTKYLVLELSFREFYKGQPPLWEILRFLHEHNYVMVARGYEWRNSKNHEELLQMDGIFMNTRLVHLTNG